MAGGNGGGFSAGGAGGTGYTGKAGSNGGTYYISFIGHLYGGGGGGGAGGGVGGAGFGGAAGGAGGTKTHVDGSAGQNSTSASSGAGGGGGGYSGLVYNGSGSLYGTYRGGAGGAGGNATSQSGDNGGGGGGAGGYGLVFNGASLTNNANIYGGTGGAGGTSSSKNVGNLGGYGGDGGVGIFEKSSSAYLLNQSSAEIVGGTGGTDGSGSFGSGIPTGRGGAGVVFMKGGTIYNFGSIEGGTSSSTYGGTGAVLAKTSMSNLGTIQGGGGVFGGAGVVASANSSVINGGTIAGGSGNYGGAVGFSGSSAYVRNAGTIRGGNANGAFGGTGISGANLSVVNIGTISGGFQYANGTGNLAAAVAFTGGVNRFTMYAGSSLTGTVDAYSTKDTFALGGNTDSTFDLAQIGNSGSNAEIRGFGTLAKSGASTWTLSGAPSTSSALAYRVEAGTLDLGGTTQTVTGLTMTGGTLTDGELDTSGSFKISGGTVAAILGGSGALSKSGAGTLTLSDDNTYSGGTTISAGTVSISTFDGSDNYTGVGTGAVLLSGGTLELAANNANLANEVDIAAGKVGRIAVVAGATDYLNYVVNGSASSRISVGAGATLALGSSVDTGTIVFQTLAGSIDTTASILIAGGTVEDPYGYLGQGFLSVAAKTTIAASATLDLEDNSDEIANLQATAASATVNTGTQSSTVLTIDAGSYAGTVTGSGKIEKATASRLVLSGANTYAGGTEIAGGTLSLAHATASDGSGTIDAAGSGPIDIEQAALEITVSGTLADEVDFTGTFSGGPDTSGTSTIGVAAGKVVTLTGAVGDDGASQITFGSATDTGTIVLTQTGGGTVDNGASLIEIAGGTLTDGGGLALDFGLFDQTSVSVKIDSGATLNLNGNTDSIGSLTGSGTLTNAAGGTTTIEGGSFGGAFAGAGTIAITGATTLSGTSTNTGATSVYAGQTLTLATGGATSAGSAIVDNGTIQLSGGALAGTSLTQDSSSAGLVTGTGTVSANVANSTLAFTSSGGALTFTGTDIFGGKLSGTEAIFAAGKDSFASGSSFTVSTFDIDGATIALASSFTYRGTFDLGAGTLSLGTITLNLYGATDLGGGEIAGSGKVGAYGTTTLDKGTVAGGSTTLIVGRSLTAKAGLSLHGSAKLSVGSKGVYDLDGNISIGAQTTSDTISNQGTIEKIAGTNQSLVTGAVANSGTIEVAVGTLDLTKTISGSGMLDIEGSSTLELGGIIGAGQTTLFGTGNGTLKLDDAADFRSTISGLGKGDLIALTGFNDMAKVLYTASSGGGGTLSVTDGKQHFSAHLSGTYTASSFYLTQSATGETIHDRG